VSGSQHALVDRYLRQSRIVRKIPTTPAVHDKHLAFFEDAIGRLGPEGPGDAVRLHLTSTANAIVETVSLPGSRAVIYDYDFGEAMRRLNEFALGDWPADPVVGWGLGHLAVSLASAGDFESAFAAINGSAFLQSQSPPQTDEKALHSASACVLIQDYFAIAHECIHLAYDEGRLARLKQLHHEDAQRAVNELRDHVAEGDSLVDALRSAATKALGGDDELCRKMYSDDLLRSTAIFMSPDLLKAGREHLEEELLCDAMATELTNLAMGPEFGEEAVMMAIFFGLSNLRSLEFIRSMGRAVEVDSRAAAQGRYQPLLRALLASSTGSAAAYRLSIWRRWACMSQVLPSETLHPALTRMSRSYAEAVGDRVLFAIGPRFQAGYETMKKKGLLERSPMVLMRLISKGCDVDVLTRLLDADSDVRR
jgi:hypothetical protein